MKTKCTVTFEASSQGQCRGTVECDGKTEQFNSKQELQNCISRMADNAQRQS